MIKLQCRVCLSEFDYVGTNVVPEHRREPLMARCIGGGERGDVVQPQEDAAETSPTERPPGSPPLVQEVSAGPASVDPSGQAMAEASQGAPFVREVSRGTEGWPSEHSQEKMQPDSPQEPATPTDPNVIEVGLGPVQEKQALPVQAAPLETAKSDQAAPAGKFDQMVAEYTRLYAQVQLGLHRELEDHRRQLTEHGSRAEEMDRQLAAMKEHASQVEAMQQRLETFREGHELTAQRIEDLRGQVEFTPLFGRQVPLRIVAIAALVAAILSVLVAVVTAL